MAPTPDDLSHLHRPVMVDEVLMHLLGGLPSVGAARPLLVDGTIGLGGHAAAILEARSDTRVLGFDRDGEALRLAARRLAPFGDRVHLVHASYAELESVLAQLGEGAPAGVLLDLGASSMQFDDPERGFSFREGREGADMRFDRSADVPTALDLVNSLGERDLANLIYEFGEEPRSRAIARALVRERPIRDAAQLVDIVRRSALRNRRHDPATRTFQALRIAVNDEYGTLERGLEVALRVCAPGGRVVVIAFHSGEERRVKQAFREAARAGRGVIRTKKPERPTEGELRENRRARPSRLRAFECVASDEQGEADAGA